MVSKNKIKILTIITRLNIGGPTWQILNHLKYFNNDEYELKIVYGKATHTEGRCEPDKEFRSNCYFVPELRRKISLLDDLKALLKIISIMLKYKPDIVHTHEMKAGLVGRLAAIIAGAPKVVHTYHGHFFVGYFNAIMKNSLILCEKALYYFTDAVITLSESQKSDLIENLKIKNDKKILTIPLGLELNKFIESSANKKALRESAGINDSAIVIGTISRLTEIKNLSLLLKAAKTLGDGENYYFTIYGDGELRSELEEESIELGIDQRVKFMGWCENAENAYPTFDAFVLTSTNEGTPHTIIEAMASGIPVVATNVGGIKDMIENGKTGFVVNPDAHEEIVEAIKRLIADKNKTDEMVRVAREKALETWSLASHIDAHGRLYLELSENID